MTRLRVAVIGVGHLGKEHARILAGMPDVELVGVADVNAEQAHAVARRLGTTAYTEYWPLLNLVDAASVVVPTTLHHRVASDFLRRGIPVLVEKPLAATLAEADDLLAASRNNHALLQVGHIERFNPGFEQLVRRPIQPKFVACERLGPFTGRSTDIGVVLDLMIHDLDLLCTLVPGEVTGVEAVGVSLFGGHEDVANARLRFSGGCVAQVTASRASVSPVRRMHVWAPEGYARVDYAKKKLLMVQPSAELRRGEIDPRRLDPAALARFREEMFTRHLEFLELDCNAQPDQLTRELQEFVACVRTGAAPRVGGAEARAAIALAEKVLHSLRGHRWEGERHPDAGPAHIPAALGALFESTADEAAA
jgi:predicted dehydrogenase